MHPMSIKLSLEYSKRYSKRQPAKTARESADAFSSELQQEMVLQELERGGYGGIQQRMSGRHADTLALAAGLSLTTTERALAGLRLRGLAAYSTTASSPHVLVWTPVRDLNDSPYTFHVGRADEPHEIPDRLDFVACVKHEIYMRELKKILSESRTATCSPFQRGRGRPRKVSV